MKLPIPPVKWDMSWMTKVIQILENEDLKNRKTNQDMEFVNDKLILRSPDGTRWKISVTNLGVVQATAL